jgi:hypothetical protein
VQPVVLSPSAGVFVVWPLRKFFLNGHTTKRIVYQVGNKDKINYTEMHGQQNIKK